MGDPIHISSLDVDSRHRAENDEDLGNGGVEQSANEMETVSPSSNEPDTGDEAVECLDRILDVSPVGKGRRRTEDVGLHVLRGDADKINEALVL